MPVLVVLTNTNSSMAVTTVPRKNVMEAEKSSIFTTWSMTNSTTKRVRAQRAVFVELSTFLQRIRSGLRGNGSPRWDDPGDPRLPDWVGHQQGWWRPG